MNAERDSGGNAGIGKMDRRAFLGGVIGSGVVAAAGALATTTSAAAATDVDPSQQSFPFEGEHQQGVLTPRQRSGAVVALDATAASRSELVDLFRTITERSRFLAAGGTPPALGISAPPSDNGILGPSVVPDGLTVTLSVGASLFDDRYGLHTRKPARLRQMDVFPNDQLDRAICDGDLLLQVCANSADTVVHALRDITKATRGGMQIRWRQDGFASAPRPVGAPRNLLGFKDGTANPDVSDATLMDDLIWTVAGGAEPAWVAGGSYHVVRVIRMLVEFWDRIGIREQENLIGRRRATGAPNDGDAESDVPNFPADPDGDVTPLDAHIRLANPRSPDTESQRMLRRPFNYDNGVDSNGNLDQGLVFIAFNQDLDRQFVTVQNRLNGESLVDYIVPVGGGYFFALPGVKSSADWLGSGLLA